MSGLLLPQLNQNTSKPFSNLSQPWLGYFDVSVSSDPCTAANACDNRAKRTAHQGHQHESRLSSGRARCDRPTRKRGGYNSHSGLLDGDLPEILRCEARASDN